MNKKVLKHFQDGGFEINNGIVSKKRKKASGTRSEQKNQIR